MTNASPIAKSGSEHTAESFAAHSARRHIALTVGLAVLGVFVTYIPITAVSVSLTTIGASTGASTADLQWVTDAYIIPMAAMILSAGVFGDIHGRRRVYLIGMALTALGAGIATLGSMAGGQNALHILWSGQAVMGAGAGLLLPTTLALIAHVSPELAARSRYIALWATGLVLGLAVAPLVSGVILQFAGWGWIFVPIIVLALLAGTLAALRLPESKSPEGRHLDWPGQITATIAIAASIYGVIEGGQAGWGSAQSVTGFVAGGLALAAFLVIEARSSSPILTLSLFRSPAFSASGVAALIALFALVGAIFLLSLFFGGVQHLSPLQIGIRLLFINAVTAIVNPFVGRLLGRWSALGLLAFGLGLGGVAMFLITGVTADSSLLDTAWRLCVIGIADAFMLSAVAVAAIHSVPHRLAGMASAANTVLRQYGGALGPAVLGVILSTQLAGGADATSAMATAFTVNGIVLFAGAAVCTIAAVYTGYRGRALDTSSHS